MAAPTWITAGTGATDAGGTWSYTCQSGVSPNVSIFIVQILQDGATNGAVTVTGSTNINKLDGSAGWDQIPGSNADGSFPVGASGEARQFLYIGRQNTTTTPTISGGNSTSEDLYILSYMFWTVSSGATLDAVIENGTAGATANGVGTSDTAADTAVTTLGPDRLALNFIAINDDNTITEFTGESNGNWTLPALAFYASASGTDGAIAMQHATMATANTINGGTENHTDPDAWGVVGFALIGTTPTGRQPRHGFVSFQDPGVF